MSEDEEISIIRGINSPEKLENYLRGKPIDWAQQIAFRCALQTFPLTIAPHEWTQEYPREYGQLTVAIWRAISISGLALVRPSIDTDDNASAIIRAASAAALHVVPASAVRAIAPASVIRATSAVRASAGAVAVRTAVTSAARTAGAAVGAFRAVSDLAYAADVWVSIKIDLRTLLKHGKVFHEPIYLYFGGGAEGFEKVTARSLRRNGMLDFAASPNIKGTHWEIISDWYLSLADSEFHTTPWGMLGSEKDLEIALKPNEFWERDPDEVMADIAGIVGWPEYGQKQTKLNADDTIIKLAAMASPEPKLDEQQRIDICPNQKFDKPEFDDDLYTLPQTLASLAGVMAKGVPQNAPLMVKPCLEEYREHLLTHHSQPILDTLKVLASILSADFESQESELWSDGLREAFALFIETHNKLITHFPLDVEREDLINSTQLDEDLATSNEVAEAYQEIWDYVPELYQDNHVTEELAKLFEGLRVQFINIKAMPPKALDDNQPSLIKRYTFRTIGVFAALVSFVGSVVSISTTTWGAKLILLLDDAVKLITAAL